MRRKTLISIAFIGFSILPALAQKPAMSAYPDGRGDPDATTCRLPQPIAGSRFAGPQVCKLNAQWALLRKNGQDISADGRDIIPDPKGSNVGPMNCTMVGGSATNGGGQMSCRSQ